MADEPNAFNPVWRNTNIGDTQRAEFPISLVTQQVKMQNPPKLGPDDDHLQWYEIKVVLVMGEKPLSEPVCFPACDPLSPQVAFAAALKAVLEG